MTQFILQRRYFDSAHKTILRHDDLSVMLWRNDSGVHFLQVNSDRVELAILPFQGQQIWNATVDGRNITMSSEVSEPVATTDYLRNYGAFLVHCGATAMGGPSPRDTHPLHGELPNATYNEAWIETGYDELHNAYVEVHGLYRHQVAMTVNYEAHPIIRVIQGSPIIDVSMSIANKSHASMDMMYLAHINFQPVIGSRIIASHKWDPQSVRVRSSFPAHIQVPEEIKVLLKELADHPEESAYINIKPEYDPEAVMMIDYIADDNGYAHSLQVHPDGTSDYMRHELVTAPHSIRCIQMTDHHRCVGFLPSTAGVEGYTAEKEAGRVISLPPNEEYSISFQCGSLDVQQTQRIIQKIEQHIP